MQKILILNSAFLIERLIIFAQIFFQLTTDSIIDLSVPTVATNYKCSRALSLMDTFKISYLPVLDGDLYVGLISEDEIYDLEIFDENIEHIGTMKSPCVFSNMHIFDALAVASQFSISIVPVVSAEMKYLGAITMQNLVNAVSKFFNVETKGAIIVLEMGKHDYSMSQISQIVESENAKILSSFVTDLENSEQIRLTIVINRTEISPIVKSLERYGYKVDTFFCESNMIDDFYKSRFEFLMNYMKI